MFIAIYDTYFVVSWREIIKIFTFTLYLRYLLTIPLLSVDNTLLYTHDTCLQIHFLSVVPVHASTSLHSLYLFKNPPLYTRYLFTHPLLSFFATRSQFHPFTFTILVHTSTSFLSRYPFTILPLYTQDTCSRIHFFPFPVPVQIFTLTTPVHTSTSFHSHYPFTIPSPYTHNTCSHIHFSPFPLPVHIFTLTTPVHNTSPSRPRLRNKHHRQTFHFLPQKPTSPSLAPAI